MTATPTLAVQHCRACGAAFFWLTGASGKPAPICALPSPKGNIWIEPERGTYRVIPEGERAAYGATLRLNHFANCSRPGQFGTRATPTTQPNKEVLTMPRGLNKIQIIGNLGKDPEMKYTPAGKAVTTFSVAVGGWNGSEETTEWFRVVAWEKLAETCNEFLHKGSRVYVEGRLQTREWTDKDGAKQKMVEIVAGQMLMLDGKPAAARPAPADDDTEIPF